MNDAKTQYETAKENGTITYENVKSCWDNYKVPILMGAIIGKDDLAVKDLIFELDADPNIKDSKTGMTPLLVELSSLTSLLSECETYDDAKEYIKIYVPMIKTLLNGGADPHISNNDDINVFDYAEILNISELNKLLSTYKNTSNNNRVLNINNSNNNINNSNNNINNSNNNNSQFNKNITDIKSTISQLKLEAFKDAPRRIKQLAAKKDFIKTQASINAMQNEQRARLNAQFKQQQEAMDYNLGGGTRRKHRGRKAKKSRRHRHR